MVNNITLMAKSINYTKPLLLGGGLLGSVMFIYIYIQKKKKAIGIGAGNAVKQAAFKTAFYPFTAISDLTVLYNWMFPKDAIKGAKNVAKEVADMLGTSRKVFGVSLKAWEDEEGVIKLLNDNRSSINEISKFYIEFSGGTSLIEDLKKYLEDDELKQIKFV